MKDIIKILLLTFSLTGFCQLKTNLKTENSIIIYVEKSNLKDFIFNQKNIDDKEVHFKFSWPSSVNYRKNILIKNENGEIEKTYEFLSGRSNTLHLKSNKDYVCIKEKELLDLIKNKNVLYFSEFNLFNQENLFEYLESDINIYIIYNDFSKKIKIFESFKMI